MKINQRSEQPSLLAFRSMMPSDGAQLATLFQTAPDNGRFAISPHYQIDPYKALLAQAPTTVGVVAESKERLVGIGLIRFGHCYVDGHNRPYAWLNSLLVHPANRQNGIGTELARRRIALARNRVGEDGVIFASVQSNNEASLNITEMWSDSQIGHLQSILVKTRTKPPAPIADVTIRKAQTEDLMAIANGLNRFYAGFDLYEPQDIKTLSALIAQTVCGKPIHQCFVAVNRKQEIVAGLILSEQHRLVAMKVDRLPKTIALLNKAIRFIPSDGILRQMAVSKIWHLPGQQEVAQYLWQMTRWQAGKWGSHLTCFFDPQSTILQILQPPKWLPKANFTIVAQGKYPSTRAKQLYPL